MEILANRCVTAGDLAELAAGMEAETRRSLISDLMAGLRATLDHPAPGPSALNSDLTGERELRRRSGAFKSLTDWFRTLRKS